MKISIINGSPKQGKNTSELLIKFFLAEIGNKHSVEIYRLSKETLGQEQFEMMAASDALLFVFPLYVDSIPSHLLKLLVKIDEKKILSKNTMVYCMINNGFFEGKQNHIAIEQMKIWCTSAGAEWGQAIGIGAGEMLPFISDIPLGHGPNKNLGYAIKCLVKNILNKEGDKNILFSPNYYRPLWKIQSTLFVWYPRAKRNGLRLRDIHPSFIKFLKADS